MNNPNTTMSVSELIKKMAIDAVETLRPKENKTVIELPDLQEMIGLLGNFRPEGNAVMQPQVNDMPSYNMMLADNSDTENYRHQGNLKEGETILPDGNILSADGFIRSPNLGGNDINISDDFPTENQEAYAEGLEIGEGFPLLRQADKFITKTGRPLDSGSFIDMFQQYNNSERNKMIDLGYDDMREAINAQ